MSKQIPIRSAQKRRIIAPDMARGLALLGIAWANITTGWIVVSDAQPAANFGGFRPGSVIDQIVIVLSAMFAHVRGLPLFSFLLGFGVGLITMSLSRRMFPPGSARRVLLRRYGLLSLFGAIHLLFLFFGDIMFLYGILAMILATMITLRDKTLLWIAGILFSLNALMGIIASTLLGIVANNEGSAQIEQWFGGDMPMTTPETYLGQIVLGLVVLVANTWTVPMNMTTIFPLLVLGFVAARQGIHTKPEQHKGLLWSWIGIAVAVIFLIGLPWGLSAIGILPVWLELPLTFANTSFGLLTGPGIAAAILLVCQPMQRRLDTGEITNPPLPWKAITALGKRSMTGYLAQSIILFILVKPFTLNLGGDLTASGLFLLALGVWLATVVFAYALELAGKPGPFENIHRQLSYGKDGLPERWSPPAKKEPKQPTQANE